MTAMDITIVVFIMIGFFAQMINGSLGMSYGTLSVTFLLALGIPPVPASSSVHISKALTGGVSGVSHWRLGNIDYALTKGLLISGVSGGIAGALVLTVLPEGILKPFIAVYLLLTGLSILAKSVGGKIIQQKHVRILPLGAAGGFIDAVGGGGWGPIVTGTLLANGQDPHKSIGSVSFAEAFVATAISVTLLFKVTTLALDWQIVAGLIIGGVIAAPLAAKLCGKLPVHRLMVAVGLLVVVLNAGLLWSSFQLL
jgi:hypothetical protein